MLLSELIRYSLVVCLFMQIQTPPLQPISLMESYNLPLIGALDHGSPSYMIPFVNMYHTHYLFLPESVSSLDNCNDFDEFPSSMNMK